MKKALFILIAALPVVAMIVAAEWYLREQTAARQQGKLEKNAALRQGVLIHQPSDDPVLVYELRPGASVEWQGIRYVINPSGFRDDPFPVPGAPVTPEPYRVVVIGDSVAWGWGVEMQQAWPYRLQQQLSTQLGRQVEVYNLAVNGYATPQEVRILEKHGLDLKPDLLILGYVLNDPEVEDGGLSRYFRDVNRIELLHAAKFFASFLVSYFHYQLNGDQANEGKAPTGDHYVLIHQMDLFKAVEDGFADLAKISQENDFEVMVVVTPVFRYESATTYPWRDVHQQVQQLAQQSGFLFYDSMARLGSQPASAVSFDEIHPNALGHQLVAEGVADALLNTPVLQVQ